MFKKIISSAISMVKSNAEEPATTSIMGASNAKKTRPVSIKTLERTAEEGFEEKEEDVGNDADCSPDASDNEGDEAERKIENTIPAATSIKTSVTKFVRRTAVSPEKLMAALESSIPAIAALRQALENAVTVLNVATALILENPRFVNDEEELLRQQASHEKVDEEFKLEIDYTLWAQQVYQLCASKDKVFDQYDVEKDLVLSLEKFRGFQQELARVAQLQAKFQTWCAHIAMQENASLTDSTLKSKWEEIEKFSNAVEFLAAQTMALSLFPLSMKSDAEYKERIYQSFYPKIEWTAIAAPDQRLLGSIEEKIEQRKKEIVSDEKSLAEKQVIMEKIENTPDQYIQDEQARFQALIDKQEIAIAALEKKLAQLSSKEDHDQERLADIRLDIASQKIYKNEIVQILTGVQNDPQIFLQSQGDSTQDYIDQSTCSIEAKKKNLECLQRQKANNDARAAAEKKAAEVWQRDFPQGIALLKKYHERKMLESFFPFSVASDIDDVDPVLRNALLTTHPDEAVKSIVRKNRHSNVRKLIRVEFHVVEQQSVSAASSKMGSIFSSLGSSSSSNLPSFNFQLTFKSETGGFTGTVVISPEHCKPDYKFDSKVKASKEMKLPPSISAVIANEFRKQGEMPTHALYQLEVAGNELTSSRSINNEHALHALIRATEPTESSLSVAIDQFETRYNVQSAPASDFENFISRLEKQDLFFNYFRTQIIYDHKEHDFFSTQQLIHLSQGNLLLQLCCIQAHLEQYIFHNKILKTRIQSIIKVFNKMIINIDALPEWIDEFIAGMDSKTERESIGKLSPVIKTKIAVGFALEFFNKILVALSANEATSLATEIIQDAKNLSAVSRFFRKIQQDFKLPFVENEKNYFHLGFNFLVAHEDELLSATNFQVVIEEEVAKAVQSTESVDKAVTSKVKSSSIVGRVKKIGRKFAGGNETKTAQNVTSHSSAAVITPVKRDCYKVDEENITLFAMLPGKINDLNNQFFMTFADAVSRSSLEEELVLNQAFIDNALEAHFVDDDEDEDEYSNMLGQQKKQKQDALEKESAAVKARPDPKLNEALEFSCAVSVVLRKLILGHARFGAAATEFPENAAIPFVQCPTTGVYGWIRQISDACEKRNHVLSQRAEIDGGEFSGYQLRQLYGFEAILATINHFARNEALMTYFNQQTQSVPLAKAEFIAAVKRLAAIMMQLCIIVLAIKKEMEPVEMANTAQHEVGKASSIDSAWTDYENARNSFNAYVQDEKLLDGIKISSQIQGLLPVFDASIDTMMEIEQPQIQSFTIELLVDPKVMIRLTRSETGQLFTAWNVNPKQLHPEHDNEAISSPTDIIHVYNEIINRLVEVKDPGATFEVDQINRISVQRIAGADREKIYSQKDKLLLIGFYGLLYISAIQKVKGPIKTEGKSRIAQALYEICLRDLGVNLRIFRKIFNRFIRPHAFISSQKSKKMTAVEAPFEVLCVQLALQVAVSTFKSNNFYRHDQFEFGIRSNPFMQLLNVPAIIQKRVIEDKVEFWKNENNAQNLLPLNALVNIIAELPARIISFFMAADSTNVTTELNKLTGLQQIKLAFVFEVEFYRDHFESLGEKKAASIFAYLQTEAGFSVAEETRDLSHRLAKKFHATQIAETEELNETQFRTEFKNAFAQPRTVSLLFRSASLSDDDGVLLHNMLAKR